jgi:hypothetical protein
MRIKIRMCCEVIDYSYLKFRYVRFTSNGPVRGQSADQRTGPTDRRTGPMVLNMFKNFDRSETCPLYVNRERTGPLSVEAELTRRGGAKPIGKL